ncbi:MAG: M4 family metallopeptidase [Labilithrix sp.]
MRFAKKLSLVAVSVLLANCGISSDEGTENAENAVTEPGSSSVAFDSREGLTSLRSETRRAVAQRSDIVASAIAYLSDAAEGAGTKRPEFTLISSTEVDPQDGLSHVRLQQTIDGIVVWGADSVVHLDAESVLGATGSVATGIDSVSKSRTMNETTALARAKQERFGSLAIVTEEESVEQVIHIADDGTPALAYHTRFYNELQGDTQPGMWNHIYDANTGALLARWNEVHTADAQASGPGGNPKWTHSWNNELDATINASGQAVLTTSRLTTLNMNHGSTASEVTGTLQNIGDAPINDAHGFAEITLNFLKDWMGRDSIDDRGFVIKSRVHYGNNYENAFWNGSQMTYGDGANRFYPLSGALDVCAHEIDHGFTSKHSNLTYSGQSGGLNEGFSDIAGKTAEAYYRTTPISWDLGADVFKTPNAALRYMCDPKRDGRSIDNASQFTSGLDPHYSSGVPNKSFCLASKRISSGSPTGTATKDGVKRAAQAYFLANAQYWTSGTTYVKGCQGVMDAARAMSYTPSELDALKQSWADVGVVCN